MKSYSGVLRTVAALLGGIFVVASTQAGILSTKRVKKILVAK